MTKQAINTLRLSFCASLVGLLTACGGGSGDVISPVDNNAAARAVEPLVGVWDLPDNWNGKENDEAYLVINAPGEDGSAVATIFDLDDDVAGAEQNCFVVDGFPGTVFQSLTNELFLDVSAYPSAIAELTPNGNLEISVYSEAAGSGVPPDRVLTATRLGFTESDINLCDS